MQYPPDPPRPEEIILVMRQAGHDRHGLRLRALIAVLWRGGLRISEALVLNETDIDAARGSLLIRRDKGGLNAVAGGGPCLWSCCWASSVPSSAGIPAAGDPLAQAHSVPPKQASTSVVSAHEVGHRLPTRFCLIRSARARRMPAARARRIPGPRPWCSSLGDRHQRHELPGVGGGHLGRVV
jgi:hypothetical protein